MQSTSEMRGALFAVEGALYHGIRVSIPQNEEQTVKLTADGETHGQAIGALIDALIDQGYSGAVEIMDASHIHTHIHIAFDQMQNLDHGEHYGETL